MQLCCTPKRLQLFTCFVGAASIITVLIILFLSNWPNIARQKLLDEVVFKDGSMSMDRFLTTKDLVNLRIEVYVYNVTNQEEVINPNSPAKIKLQQIGPFVYHEYKTKELVNNDQTTGLIEYKLRKQYTFRRDLSIDDPKKLKIYWPNVPLIVAKSLIDNFGFFERNTAYALLNHVIESMKEPAFMYDTIDNFLFNGSKRELFEHLQGMDFFHLIKPWPLPGNKFGILYGRNNTWRPGQDHQYTASAGFGINQTYKNLNEFVYIDGLRDMPFWRKEPSNCNKIGGTDGQFFSPFLNKSNNLEVFSSDICRKLSLKFRDNVNIDGVNVYKYTLDERSLQSRLKNLDNDCYCLARDSTGQPLEECDLDGLIDLSQKCVAPNVLASGMHFLHGSSILRQRLSGLPPANFSEDDPTLYVEPNTGLTIRVRVPIQLNIRLQAGGFNVFKWFQDDHPLIIPLVNIIEAAELTDEQSSMLRNKLLLLDSWFVSMVLGGAIIFIFAIVAAILVIYMKVKSHKITEPSESDPLLSSVTLADEEINRDLQPPQENQGSEYQSI